MIRIWRFEISPISPASFFAFERSERQRTNDTRQSRNTKLVLLVLVGSLSACAQYREPTVNCFAFRAAVAPVEPDCIFIPLETAEVDVEV